MTLAALIFDVDGTLAETEEAHRQSFNDSFAAQGLDWHWTADDYRRLLKTTGGKERMLAHQSSLPAAEWLTDGQIAALHHDKTRRYVDLLTVGGLDLRPGVADLIDAARARGLALAIATTTSAPNVDALCRCCWGKPARDIFDVTAAGDEVSRKKPAPDVYLLALERLGLGPEAAIAFEDSKNGLQSALAAGLRVVITPGLYTADEDFSGAETVRASLEGYRPWP